jgi:hypothetical protein
MPESLLSKEFVENFQDEYGPKSDTPMKNLPLPDIPTQNMQTPNTPTRKSIKKETNPPKSNIPGSASSDPPLEDKLTPAQEKMRVRLATMYAGLGATVAGFKAYTGIVLIKSAEDRAEEVVRACRHNKAAWQWLERIVSGSDLTTCLLGHGIMLYAIMSHSEKSRLPKNEQLLQMFGYADWQVLAPPQSMGEPNIIKENGRSEMTQAEYNAFTRARNTGDTGDHVATGV